MPGPASPAPSRSRFVLIDAGLVLAVLLVYLQAIQFQFVKVDDGSYVTRNPHVLDGLSRSGVAWAFRTFEASNWHPLTWISLMADAELGGADPRVYHGTNVLLHLASTLLLFHLLQGMTRAVWRSALVAGLFAVHPLHVESVAWVAERKDVLSTFFWFLALAAYARYARRPATLRYSAVLLAFALGLLAKPMLVTLPLTLLFLDYWPLRRIVPAAGPKRIAPVLWEKLPLLALSASSSAVTLAAQWSAVGSLEAVPLATRLANAAVAYVTYLAKTLWPSGLMIPYLYVVPVPPSKIAASVILLAAVSWVVARGAARRPHLVTGWLWYLVTLVPVIGLVQVGEQCMADRYTYVPLVGIFVMLAWSLPDPRPAGVARARGGRAALAAGAMLALGSLAWVAHRQAGHWRSPLDLVRHSVEVGPRNALARMGLAQELAEVGRHDEAIAEYRAALELRPSALFAHLHLAESLALAGRTAEALDEYHEAVRLAPEHVEARTNLGILLMRTGRLEEAESQLAEAARLKPKDAEIRAALGLVLAQVGRLAEAEVQFAEALRIDPGSVPAQKGIAVVRAKLARATLSPSLDK